MQIRELTRDRIPDIWKIDRSEVIENIYYLRDGKLMLEPEHFDMHGWSPGEPEHYSPYLLDCFDRGGTFWGVFENDVLIGTAILESKFIGGQKDTLQLKFLHISQRFRKKGLGKKLFHLCARKALESGAKKIYISATPSENTVDFYLRLGCVLATEIDEKLFALEPGDIHLEFNLGKLGELQR